MLLKKAKQKKPIKIEIYPSPFLLSFVVYVAPTLIMCLAEFQLLPISWKCFCFYSHQMFLLQSTWKCHSNVDRCHHSIYSSNCRKQMLLKKAKQKKPIKIEIYPSPFLLSFVVYVAPTLIMCLAEFQLLPISWKCFCFYSHQMFLLQSTWKCHSNVDRCHHSIY